MSEELNLEAIEARANDTNYDLQSGFRQDINRLIAEVRRLRENVRNCLYNYDKQIESNKRMKEKLAAHAGLGTWGWAKTHLLAGKKVTCDLVHPHWWYLDGGIICNANPANPRQRSSPVWRLEYFDATDWRIAGNSSA